MCFQKKSYNISRRRLLVSLADGIRNKKKHKHNGEVQNNKNITLRMKKIYSIYSKDLLTYFDRGSTLSIKTSVLNWSIV